MDCKRCGKPEPSYHCWDGLTLNCPFGLPPKYLHTDDLWWLIVDLHKRLTALEDE